MRFDFSLKKKLFKRGDFSKFYVSLHRKHTFQRLELFCAFKVLVNLLSIYRSGPPVKVPHLFKKKVEVIFKFFFIIVWEEVQVTVPLFLFPKLSILQSDRGVFGIKKNAKYVI